MLYYLTLVWNPESADQTAFATQKKLELLHRKEPNWQVALDTKGMVVLYHILGNNILHDIHRLPDEKGVIIGKLFKRSYINEHSAEHMPDPVAFDRTLTDKVISSGGKSLIDDFWGGYIAFLRDTRSHDKWILRDPTGEFPCQQARLGDIDVYFIRLEDFDQLSPKSLTINTHFLTGFLVYGTLCRRETGIEEIETILAGECAIHHGNEKYIASYWNAMDIAQNEPIYDFKEAVEEVRLNLRSCVHAWTSCFDGVVLSLSGGLDSSIIATCLMDAPNHPKVLCRNYFSADAPNADERKYARAVAEKCNHEIVHIPTEEDLDNDFDPTRIRSMYPSGWPIDINEHLDQDTTLKNDGFTAEFYGHSGDELFCRNNHIPLSVDQAWRFGINRKLLSTVGADSKIRTSSYWRILKIANHYGIRKRKWHIKNVYQSNTPSLINKDTYDTAIRDESHWHPLFQAAPHFPPAKFEHCYSLTYGLSTAHIGINTWYPLPARSPLKSQPLLELCLRIFMPLHQNRGIDRAVARQAFSTDLPHIIAFRRSKAHGTQKIKNLLELKFDEVRDHLIDGKLTELNVLDRDAVAQCLQSRPSTAQAETLQICNLMSIEAWIRRMQ